MSKTTTTESSSIDEIPDSDVEVVRKVIREDDDLKEMVVSQEWGYGSAIKEAIINRWGEEALPTSEPTIYMGAEQVREEENRDGGGYAEMPTSVEDRALVVLREESDIRDLIDGDEVEEAIEAVKDEVRERWGVTAIPTEGAVQRAIAELRQEGTLPPLGGGEPLDSGVGPVSISYVCQLCGYEDSDPWRVRNHVTKTTDFLHSKRKGTEPGVVKALGEPIDQPNREEGEWNDDLDIVWTIYNNPDANQEEIAAACGWRQSSLSSKLKQMGIEWDNRREDVRKFLSDIGVIEARESVTRKNGNRTYKGPDIGLDLTDHKVSYLSEVESPSSTGNGETQARVKTTTDDDGGIGVVLDAETATRLVTGDPDTTQEFRRHLLTRLLDSEVDPEAL